MLKDRSGRGFDRLGRQAGVSGSSLHRYCSGASVPADYGVLHQFAQVCGASRDELRTLHRLWALADASRGHPPAAPPGGRAAPVAARPPGRPAAAITGRPAVSAQRGQADNGTTRAAGWLRPGITAAAAGICAVLVAAAAWVGNDPAQGAASRVLLAEPCAGTVAPGQSGRCVTEVQRLLRGAGAALAADGRFGQQTERLVMAYQVEAGLTADGSVGTSTKPALYAQKVSLATWSPAQVGQQIREVFTEAPDDAVELARCQSLLDPLWIATGAHGVRNWGVFQLTDAQLRSLGGSRRQALDPVWNIQAAHRLWQERGGFGAWPLCAPEHGG